MIPNSPNNALPLSEQEKTALSKEIFIDILENIFATYENATKEAKEANVGKKGRPSKKEKSCLLSFFIPKTLLSQKPLFLSDFAGAHNMQVLRTLEFSDKALKRNYIFKLVQVHHQHVFNLCGYHTLYNLIEVCKLIKSQNIQMSPKELFNPANFWKFRFQCAQYLDNYANHNGFNRTQYPWQDYHVKYGDLERGYVKPLTNDNGSFQSLVASDKNFKISHMTFGFQFKRLLYSAESLDKMQKDITEFVKAKDSPVHHMQMIMMGVTNHWFLFFAHRYLDHVEFWMLDSKNRDTLLWNKQEIDEFLKNENEKRQKEGRPIMNSFRLWIAHNAILDSQASVKLLVDCFLGNTTLYHFVADSETKIVAQGFLETFFDPEMDARRATNQTREEAFLTDAEIDVREVIKMTREAFKNSKGDDRVQLVKKAEEYVLSYYTTFRTFLLGDKAAYLYPESRALLLEILDVSKLILTASTRQSRLLYAFRELLAELDLSEVKAA